MIHIEFIPVYFVIFMSNLQKIAIRQLFVKNINMLQIFTGLVYYYYYYYIFIYPGYAQTVKNWFPLGPCMRQH